MKIKGLCTALACTMAIPVVARTAEAQPAISRDVAFKTITKSSYSSLGAPSQKVVRSAAEYRQLLGEDPPADLDFTKEDVLVVTMGAQPSSGYAIEITKITRNLIGITGGWSFVRVKESRPAPGAIGLTVITNPIHVVRCEKGTQYVFQTDQTDATDPVQSFSKITVERNNASARWWSTLTFDAAGKLHFELAGIAIFPAPPLDGVATPEELAEVKELFKAADVTKLPAVAPDFHHLPAGGTVINLTSRIGSKDHKFQVSEVSLANFPAVKRLLARLDQIRDRLQKPAPAASFKTITYSSLNGFAGFLSTTLSVDAGGKARLQKSSPVAKFAPIDGQATPAELKALKDAFAAADVRALHGKNVSDLAVPDAPTFTVSSVVGADTFVFKGNVARIAPALQGRVEPLLDAIQSIIRRLENPAPIAKFEKLKLTSGGGIAPFYTTLELLPNGTATVERKFHTVGPMNQKITGKANAIELRSVIDAFKNADVTTLPSDIPDPRMIMDIGRHTIESRVDGVDYRTSANAGYYQPYENRFGPLLASLQRIMDRLLEQGEVRDLNGFVSVSEDGTVRVNVNKSSVWEVTNEPFKSLLKSFDGQYVTAKAKVHPYMFGGTAEVLSLEAKATRDLKVRKSPSAASKAIGTIEKGDKVTVTGKGNNYYYEVRINGTQKGFALRSGLRLGSPSPTIGLTGAIPD